MEQAVWAKRRKNGGGVARIGEIYGIPVGIGWNRANGDQNFKYEERIQLGVKFFCCNVENWGLQLPAGDLAGGFLS